MSHIETWGGELGIINLDSPMNINKASKQLFVDASEENGKRMLYEFYTFDVPLICLPNKKGQEFMFALNSTEEYITVFNRTEV